MELTRHALAANNLLFGVSNFVVLPLPAEWELLRSPFAPEVDRQTRRGDISWVREGRATHLLIHRGRRLTVECRIDIAPRRLALKVPAGARGWSRGQLEIGGHPAAFVIGVHRRGWWPRLRLAILRASFYCEPLGRGIGVELLSEGGEEPHLRELLPALSQLQCH
jgi:hypothetical protein